MAELLGGLPVGQLGLLGTLLLLPWAALVWTVRRIITGDLVTRQQLLDARQQLQDKETDCAYWRTIADTAQQIGLKQGMTQERQLVIAESTLHVVNQIQAGLFRSEGPQ